MRIESGATRDRRLRVTLVTAGTLFMAGYFAYDGWIGYPKANLAQLTKLRPPDATGEIRIDDRVVAELNRKSESELRTQLGEPPMKSPTDRRYFGVGGFLTLGNEPGATAAWFPLQHSGSDLWGQKALAGVVGLVGLYLLFGLRGVFAHRVVLDDAGLHPRPGVTIPWEAMTALDSSRYRDKGWVDLKHDEGRRSVRLDSYHLAEFNALVRELCRRKGFECPLSDASEAAPADTH